MNRHLTTTVALTLAVACGEDTLPFQASIAEPGESPTKAAHKTRASHGPPDVGANQADMGTGGGGSSNGGATGSGGAAGAGAVGGKVTGGAANAGGVPGNADAGTAAGGTNAGQTKLGDLKPATVGNGSMVALAVRGRERVENCHRLALSLGASDEGAPVPRGPGFYGAYFLDPDGNKLRVFTYEDGGPPAS